MHLALAAASDNRAMTPVPFPADGASALADEASRTARELHGPLVKARPGATPLVAQAIDTILDRLSGLDAQLTRLAGAVSGGLAIRVHGDYHLGQLLAQDAGFRIVDFEGDTNARIDVRRRRRSPLEDVAGLIRSLRSAAWVSLLSWSERHPGPMEGLADWARAWGTGVQHEFVRAYVGAADTTLLPDKAGRDALLTLHLIVKALEDARDELAQRPAMAPAALLALADEL
jgi:maltose alpha-D-glucosyltransferase/alpha-amylase